MPLSRVEALKLVRKFDCLGLGFPRTTDGIDALADAFIAIVGDKEKADWLSQAIIMGCSRCPTPIEMRRIFERKYAPADGRRANEIDQADLLSNGGKKDV